MNHKATQIFTGITVNQGIRRLCPPTKRKALRPMSTNDNFPLQCSDSKADEQSEAFMDYQKLFVSQRSEAEFPIKLRVVAGAVPANFPGGTYYLLGPGMFADDHGSTVHPLDGHGYLRAFSFDGITGELTYMAKYVRTEAREEEHDHRTGTWRFTYRGPFSVLRGGKTFGNVKVMKNAANTCVLCWGGRLLCLWEGAVPYQLHPKSLDTFGTLDVTNKSPQQLRNGARPDMAAAFLDPLLHGIFNMPRKRTLSHCKIDAERNRLLTVSCNAEDMLLPRSHFTFHEFDHNFNLVFMREFAIPDHLMVHDWAFTDSHYVIFANRVKLDPYGTVTAVCGISPMISALKPNPEKPTSQIYLLPRFFSSDNRIWKKPVEVPLQLWLLHVANAFEFNVDCGNREFHLLATCCSYRWFSFHTMFGYKWRNDRLDPSVMNLRTNEAQLFPRIVKISFTLDSAGILRRCSAEPLKEWNKATDFPVTNPSLSGRKNLFIYAASASGERRSLPHFPFDTIVKIDTKYNKVLKWSAGARSFVGEPIFVPNGMGEDDGYILVVQYAVAMERCYLVILNAKHMVMTAKAEVPPHLNFPVGFHGFWHPDVI